VNTQQHIPTAEIADRHRQRTAVAFLAMALMYLAMAAEHLVEGIVGEYLEVGIIGMALLVLALLLPVALWKIRKLPGSERHLYFSSDGFTAQTLSQALRASWGTTLVTIIILAIFSDNKYLSGLSGEFYLQLVVAIMLGVVSTAFLVLNGRSARFGLEEAASA